MPALVVALSIGVAASAAGQSLGDVARQEEERRKAVKKPGKVYTNKDIAGAGTEALVAPPPPASATATADPPTPADAKAKEPAKDQAFWAARMKGLRAQLDRDETYLAALESRVNALNADFVNRDDPAQRATIENNRKKALAELASLKQQVEGDKRAIAELEEEARRANVPPGWLR